MLLKLPFFLIHLLAVRAQVWKVTTTNTGFPSDNDVAVRIYGNYAALLGNSLRFCYYQNSNVENCLTQLGTACRAGDFYDDGNDVYFLALGYDDQKIYVYQLSLTGKTPQMNLKQAITVSDNPTTISIDYYHRWMAVGGRTYLFIFDILNPTSISLKSASTSLYLSRNTYGLSGTSIYKNRVCTCANDVYSPAGLICYTVSRGTLSSGVRYHPSFGFRSVKIYDDLIITGMGGSNNIWIFDSSMSLLGKTVVTTTSSIIVMDFFRAGNVIISGNAGITARYFDTFDASDPANPVLFASTLVIDRPASFSPAPDALFGTLRIDDWNAFHIKASIDFPAGQNWSTLYANSEWNGYGRVKNTLQYRATTYTVVYGQSDTIILNSDITDMYLPLDVTIIYTLVTVPFDYALEKFQTNWVALTSGQTFQPSDIANQFIRIRNLNKENPLVRNLNQTITLIANNGRGSQLQFSVFVTRIYQVNSCVPFGICNASSSFTCVAGAQLTTDGRQCTPCPANTYKSSIGIQNCTQCPLNSNCTAGSTRIQCQSGFVFQSALSTCVLVSTSASILRVTTAVVSTTIARTSSSSATTIMHATASFAFVATNTIITPKLNQTTSARIGPPSESSAVSPEKKNPSNGTKLKDEPTPEITFIVAGAGAMVFIALISVFSVFYYRKVKKHRAKTQSVQLSTFGPSQLTHVSVTNGPRITVTSSSNNMGQTSKSRTKSSSNMRTSASNYTKSFINGTKFSTQMSALSGITTHLNTTNPLALPGYLLLEYDEDFNVESKLGEGGFSTVYRGIAINSDLQQRANYQPLAVKIMKETRDKELVEQSFKQEVAIMADLVKYDHFVKVLGFTMTPKTIVMQIYSHGDFAQLIHGSNQSVSISDSEWSPKTVMPLILDLAGALMFLHSKEISHNDLKPENMFVDRRPDRIHLILGDFSFANVRSAAKRGVNHFQFSTLDGMSVAFAAPEIFKTMRGLFTYEQFIAFPLHARDVFSFGVLLWEVITRLIPWQGFDQTQIIEEVLTGKRPDMQVVFMSSKYKSWVPLMRIGQRCWVDDPMRRLFMSDIVQQIRDEYN